MLNPLWDFATLSPDTRARSAGKHWASKPSHVSPHCSLVLSSVACPSGNSMVLKRWLVTSWRKTDHWDYEVPSISHASTVTRCLVPLAPGYAIWNNEWMGSLSLAYSANTVGLPALTGLDIKRNNPHSIARCGKMVSKKQSLAIDPECIAQTHTASVPPTTSPSCSIMLPQKQRRRAAEPPALSPLWSLWQEPPLPPCHQALPRARVRTCVSIHRFSTWPKMPTGSLTTPKPNLFLKTELQCMSGRNSGWPFFRHISLLDYFSRESKQKMQGAFNLSVNIYWASAMYQQWHNHRKYTELHVPCSIGQAVSRHIT